MSAKETVYIDATDHIAGRLCSEVAKLLLSGKRVILVNAERALISGNRASVIREWKERLDISSRVNPLYGPIHYRRPDNIIRRMIRGMVPRTKAKGRLAMKRLRVYIGIPEELKSVNFSSLEYSKAKRATSLYVSVADIAKELGWRV